MSFDLAIAVKRDPGKGAAPKPVIALAKTLVFEASGAPPPQPLCGFKS
jgi:hypothetical protein